MSGLTLEFVVPRNDPWRKLAGEDGPISHPKPAAHLLLTLAQWHAVRHTWPVDLAVGVSFPNDHDVEDLAEDLPRLALIELQFPKWTDGRAYSQARLLRTRYRFSGEVRAGGDVVADMAPLLARTGFSTVVLRADQNRDIAERALKMFTPVGHYQGDAHVTQPRFARTV